MREKNDFSINSLYRLLNQKLIYFLISKLEINIFPYTTRRKLSTRWISPLLESLRFKNIQINLQKIYKRIILYIIIYYIYYYYYYYKIIIKRLKRRQLRRRGLLKLHRVTSEFTLYLLTEEYEESRGFRASARFSHLLSS